MFFIFAKIKKKEKVRTTIMNKTTKIILTTVIASAVLGGAGVVKASDEEIGRAHV